MLRRQAKAQHRSKALNRCARPTLGGLQPDTTRQSGVTDASRVSLRASSNMTRDPKLCPNRANGLSSSSIAIRAYVHMGGEGEEIEAQEIEVGGRRLAGIQLGKVKVRPSAT